MRVRLDVEIQGKAEPEEVFLRHFPALVGRHEECKLRITSRLISRRHCLLDERDGRLVIIDLGSANGTIVNGRRIDADTVLSNGDSVEIGPVRFVVGFEMDSTECDTGAKDTTLGLVKDTTLDPDLVRPGVAAPVADDFASIMDEDPIRVPALPDSAVARAPRRSGRE